MLPSYSYAKTQGHYFGIDTGIAHMNFNETRADGGMNIIYNSLVNFTDDAKAFHGLYYKYAFNHNNIFFSPGIFYDDLNLETEMTVLSIPLDNYWRVKNRYGFKLDIGYDLSNKFALLANIGYAITKSEADISTLSIPTTSGTVDLSGKVKENNQSLLGGIGAKFSLTNNIDFNLSYEFSSVSINFSPNALGAYTSFKLRTLRSGLSYKF